MFDAIAGNRRQSYVLLSVVVLLIAGVGYVFGLYFELGRWFVAPAVAFALLMAWGSYYYSDSIVLSMSQAHPATREKEPYLWNTVEGLSIAAGLPVPRCYIIEDSAPNAFATGRDPQHAAIAVTRGLLEKMNRMELEGVIAHEMSHVGNYDIRFMTLVTVLVGTVVLLSDWMLRARWYGGRRSRGRGHPILLLIGLVFVILSPIIAELMKLALSRRREFLADATAAKLTRYPEGLANALEKLAADTEPLEVANKATAHLYIINPLTEHKGWANKLFSTHPPLEERVARLRGM
ncbi:MAG TPA: M48 family metallopeptidase [Armatimonadota bacterium]|nr:M48 family metallopeptidase [Armatimonadota bacterium]